jgi:hypothetical protein
MSTYFGPDNSSDTTANINGLVTSNLRLYLDAGRQSSYPKNGSTWYDLSGNSTNIVFYKEGGTTFSSFSPGPPTFSTNNLGEFTFDGVNDWGKFSSNFSGGSAQSFSVWVKFSSTSQMGLFSHYSGGPVNVGYQVKTGKMSYIYYVTSWQEITASTNVNSNTWVNLTWTKSGTSMIMYVNGVSDFTTTLVGDVGGNFGCIASNWGPGNSESYGAGTDSYGTVFNGSLAVLLFYTKQLSSTEVLQNYNCLRRRFGL